LLPAGAQGAFPTQGDAGAAWKRHGAAILSPCQPGTRPWGFYQFELGIPMPRRWWDELEVLMDHSLIEAAEAVCLERANELLSGSQSPDLYAALVTGGFTRLCSVTRESMSRMFRAAAKWHDYRERPALAGHYRELAATAQPARAQNFEGENTRDGH
jgi:hypothetical protein